KFDLIPDNWKAVYSPIDSVDSSIYNSILHPVTDDEWISIFSTLPSGKAAGLSGIPYEMLKHLSPDASKYLRDLISLCFSTSFIPSEWKNATIYPIPKPHEWNCYLSNTRPITLLDTARKLMTRLMYKRLSTILSENSILQGGNFAGLPGGSCDPPIALMDMLIRDASAHNKPLFILQQDISKAFDSMDTNMLRLAMQRLKIPDRFISLTMELFTGRFNSVITSYGSTLSYKTHIGIDQGEVISPLLWVIYIDPLLTMLNSCNPAPYTLNTDPNIDPVDLSTIGYMDDTNLISSSTEGIVTMFSTAQEFYNFNNTKINFQKAIMVCNRDLSDNNLPISSQPASFTFNLGDHSFALS